MNASGAIGTIRRAPKRSALAVLMTAAVIFSVTQWSSIMAGPGPRQKDIVIDGATRKEVVETLIADLNQYYVFPDKAKEIEASLRARQQRGAYDSISSAEKFAAVLTDDLRAVSKDRHLGVDYSEEEIPVQGKDDAPPAEERAQELAEVKRHNFGIETVQRLPANIGYLDLRAFAPPDMVKAKFAAAMSLLSDTGALIIDLRKNHGGEPESVALLASYLFDQRTHLNDIYLREGDRTEQSWTTDALDGPRYGATRQVYLLTSHDTFSAGEDFSYALKNLKRATVVGEATGGGAHPGDHRRAGAHFAVFVPGGRSISPITHTDWEGVGVTPDVAVSAKSALDVAQARIVKGFLAVEKNPDMREMLTRRLNELD